jgi:hypothetical protein
VREAVQAFDLPCLEQDGFEADDLIATYVREACEAGATSTPLSPRRKPAASRQRGVGCGFYRLHGGDAAGGSVIDYVVHRVR